MLGISCGLSAISCTMLLHLIIFHLYLQHKQMSTYDYILAERARKAKASDKQAPTSKRSREKVAPEDGHTQQRGRPGAAGQGADAAASGVAVTVSGVTMGTRHQTKTEALRASESGLAGDGGLQEATGRENQPVVAAVTQDGQVAEILPHGRFNGEASCDQGRTRHVGKMIECLKPLPPPAPTFPHTAPMPPSASDTNSAFTTVTTGDGQ